MRWGWVLVVLAGCGPGGSADAGEDGGGSVLPPESCESVTANKGAYGNAYSEESDAPVAGIRVWAQADVPDEWGLSWAIIGPRGDVYEVNSPTDGVGRWADFDLGSNFSGPYSASIKYVGSTTSPDTLTVDCVAFEVVE